ncbi:MAG: hypothetical protein WCQ95_04510 [Bacteroidota bacterium]
MEKEKRGCFKSKQPLFFLSFGLRCAMFFSSTIPLLLIIFEKAFHYHK